MLLKVPDELGLPITNLPFPPEKPYNSWNRNFAYHLRSMRIQPQHKLQYPLWPNQIQWRWLPSIQHGTRCGTITVLCENWSFSLEIGRFLRIAVAWVQINVGIGYPIFQNAITHLPHFESKWLNSMRQFLRTIQGEL